MTDAEIRERFFSFLKATAGEHELAPPGGAADLAILPAALRPYYERFNGAALFDGNLLLFPARGAPDEDGTVEHASRMAREAEWYVPEEVVLFGRETEGEVVGIWTGARDMERYVSPVVLTGLIFAPAAHSLLATSVERYLLTRMVWECMGTPFSGVAFEKFGVPEELRSEDLDELDGESWFAWSDPRMPALPGDPYEAPLTAGQIAALLSRSASQAVNRS
jgi:hypothetical protein